MSRELNRPSIKRILSIVRVAVIFIIPCVFGIVSVSLGKDANWDLRNYHYYGAYAFLNDRLTWDIAPAQLQTFFSPVLDIPFYWMTGVLPAEAVGFILGFVHGFNIVLLFLILWLVIRIENEALKFIVLALVAGLSAVAPGFISEIGTTFNDNIINLFGFGALWLLLVAGKTYLGNPKRAQVLVLCAGLLMGIGIGLKNTLAIYAIASGLSLFVLFHGWKTWLKFTGLYLLGGLAGALLSGGYWFWKMWVTFGNPLLPSFNAIFRSPYINPWNYVVVRFLPKTLVETLIWPLVFSGDTYRVNEIKFSDIRFAVLYLLVILLAIKIVLTWLDGNWDLPPRENRVVENPSGNFLLLFCILAFIIWMIAFSVYRYLIVIELLLPLCIWMVLERLIASNFIRVLIAVVLSALILVNFTPLSWERLDWSDPYVSVDTAMIPPDSQSLVLMLGFSPISYSIPFFPSGMRFVRADGNMNLEENTLFVRQVKSLLNEDRNRSFYILYSELEKLDPAERLAALGLTATIGECRLLKSTFPDGLKLCQVRQE